MLNLNKKSLYNNMEELKKSRGLKLFSELIIFGVVLFTLVELYIIVAPYTNKPVKSDVAIVLGCKIGTPFLNNRVEKAYNLYKEGVVKKIVVTGGKGESQCISEGQWEMDKLISLGMKKEDIILEDKSKDTFENIKFAKELMDRDEFQTVILVSNSFHLRRAQFLAKGQQMQVSLSGVFDNKYIGHEIYGYFREVPALIKDILLHFIIQ